MASDIETLVTRWKRGDEAAAEALYNLHRPRLYALAYSLLDDGAEADDVVQVTLVYALTNIARYSPDRASFNTWLHTIAISRCRDQLRRRRPFLFSLTHWLSGDRDITDWSAGQEQRTTRSETQGEVLQAVQSLSQPLREAVLLRFWAGHTFREMAEILGCPVATAQSRVRLAYQQLRAALAEGGPAWLAEFEEETPGD